MIFSSYLKKLNKMINLHYSPFSVPLHLPFLPLPPSPPPLFPPPPPSQCVENDKKFKYDSPVLSQNDVNKMFTKIQKLNEQDQLSVMRRKIKLKKLIFSDLPSDFILLKQYNNTAKQMFQNLLALHAVDPSNQETITVEDIYEVTDSLSMLPLMTGSKKPRSKSNTSQQASAET